MPPLTAIDAACAVLREHARRAGIHRYDVTVCADGRVAIVAYDARGYTAWKVRGDIAEDSSDQMPSAAFADMVNGS